jgi:hypothetical protein
MAPDGSCGRKKPGGEYCGKPVPDARGTYVAVNESSYEAPLCPECESELLLTFLSDARVVKWRARPPRVAEGGSVWDVSDVRTGLKLSGNGALAGKSGPISAPGLAVWDELVCQLGPAALLERVRAGKVFDPAQEALVLRRVAENREASRPSHRDAARP